MKKQNIYVSIAIIVAAILVGIYLGQRKVDAPGSQSTTQPGAEDKAFTLSCDADKQLAVTFHLPEDKTIDLLTSDGRSMMLVNSSTATTASYTTEDGTTTLALTGASLTLSENGTPTFQNCVLATDAPAA